MMGFEIKGKVGAQTLEDFLICIPEDQILTLVIILTA
jgi:hypothetical protein